MSTTLTGRRFTGPNAADASRHRRSVGMAWLFYLVLIFFAMVYLFPFILQIGTTFKSDADASTN